MGKHTLDQHHTGLRVALWGNTHRPTSHWVEDSSMGKLTLDQLHTGLRVALWGNSHWVRVAPWEHTLDPNHIGLRLYGIICWTNITLG